jgi:hypothetical protein
MAMTLTISKMNGSNIASPSLGKGVVEVLKVAVVDILDPEIINCQVEPYRTGFMSL